MLRAADLVFSDCPSVKSYAGDADGLHSPSGLRQLFSGHPCPETADVDRTIENTNILRKSQTRKSFCPSAVQNQSRVLVHSLFFNAFVIPGAVLDSE